MLCNLLQNNKEKCADYWNNKNLKNYEINILNEEKDEDIVIKNFQVINKELKDDINITHIHLTSWGVI